MSHVAWSVSVSLSVSVLGRRASPSKTDEPRVNGFRGKLVLAQDTVDTIITEDISDAQYRLRSTTTTTTPV